MWKMWEDSDRPGYKALDAEETDSLAGEVGTAPRRSRIQTIATYLTDALRLCLKLCIVGIVVWGASSIGGRISNSSITRWGPPSCSCGGTTTIEAVKRGCIFTPLAIAWLPPHCLDMELAAEFDEAGPDGHWEYWADPNATIPMTREELALLADSGEVFYTTQEWHITHCMFTWRKQYRSQFTGTIIEARSNGIRHIEHCESIVKIRQPLEKIWTHAGIELNADLV